MKINPNKKSNRHYTEIPQQLKGKLCKSASKTTPEQITEAATRAASLQGNLSFPK